MSVHQEPLWCFMIRTPFTVNSAVVRVCTRHFCYIFDWTQLETELMTGVNQVYQVNQIGCTLLREIIHSHQTGSNHQNITHKPLTATGAQRNQAGCVSKCVYPSSTGRNWIIHLSRQKYPNMTSACRPGRAEAPPCLQPGPHWDRCLSDCDHHCKFIPCKKPIKPSEL